MYKSTTTNPIKGRFGNIRQHLLNYVSDSSGNVGMMLGIMMIPLLIAVGAAVDYTRMISTVQSAQDTVDAAVLHAAHEYYQSYSRENAGSVGNFAANFHLEENSPGDEYVVETVVDSFENQSLTLKSTITGTSNHRFMSIFGNPKTEWTTVAYSEVSVPQVEIIMVIDVSASMRGTKIAQLKTAMEDFFDNIAPYRQGDSYVAISVIPFAENVNFGIEADDWLHPSARDDFNGCFKVLDTDQPRSLEPAVLGGSGGRFDDPYCPPSESEAILFATEREPLIEHVRNLGIGYGTHTERGLTWGERMLDNQWRRSARQIAQDAPVRVRDETQKVVILLTDGAIAVFDEDQDGRAEPRAQRRANSQAAHDRFTERCQSLDAQPNLDLYAVAYSVRNNELETLLRNCVSGDGQYFDAQIDNLDAVFERIAASLSEVRISG